jgi:hypothetical protein
MDNVNNVLGQVLSGLGLDRRLREHTLVSMWSSFVPAAIAQRSRPLFIDSSRNLVVSVADAATGQELSMLKNKVLSQLAPAARSLNIDIRGLRVDMKYFKNVVTDVSTLIPVVEPLPKPTEQQLQEIELTAGDELELRQLKDQLAADAGSTEVVRKKILSLFEIELRLRRWRFQKDFPVCRHCGNPVERLHRKPGSNTGDSYRCLACLYLD